MKKKIKDLTIAEIRRICKGHYCTECPFYKKGEELGEYILCFFYIPASIPNLMLDEEIEIPEEEENEQKV